jgi:hypothetical protein
VPRCEEVGEGCGGVARRSGCAVRLQWPEADKCGQCGERVCVRGTVGAAWAENWLV